MFCKQKDVYLCPSKKVDSQEYIDYENCELFNLNPGNEHSCNNLNSENLMTYNFSWVMTDDVTQCCYEVCSDEQCSNKVEIGITKKTCRDCKGSKCEKGDRWHYWHTDFSISSIQQIETPRENILAGLPLECSVGCDSIDCSLNCKNKP